MRIRLKTFCSILGILATVSTTCQRANAQELFLAQGWSFRIENWLASASKFDEQPGPQTSGHVWGKFDTNMLLLNVEKELAYGFSLEGSFGMITMLPNTMYLHSESVSTEFDGSGSQWLGTLYYTPLRMGRSHVGVGFGYQTVSAIKRFRNLQQDGAVVRPGDWGDYKISYAGMLFAARGEVWMLPFLGVSAKIIGSPAMSNHTEVTGYGDTQIEEAKGLRFKLEGGLTYAPLPLLELSAGYRYEDLYFEPPTPDSFSLAILYSGPWAEMRLRF